MKLSEIAEEYAKSKHADVNHLYAGKPYHYHLGMVVNAAMEFIYLIPEPDRQIVLAACWAHDVIEDTRQTYNDVKKVLGKQVADIVYAVTNEKGKTRKERANEKYYRGIMEAKYAGFVKACDRLANVRYSKMSGSGMLGVYKSESAHFFANVATAELEEIFTEIEHTLYPNKRPTPLNN